MMTYKITFENAITGVITTKIVDAKSKYDAMVAISNEMVAGKHHILDQPTTIERVADSTPTPDNVIQVDFVARKRLEKVTTTSEVTIQQDASGPNGAA